MVSQLCRCAAPGGVVSIMTGNAKAMAVRPAMERRWEDALASFDATTEIGVLGVQGRADTVEGLSDLMRRGNVEPLRWYGVWLFVDWLEFSGATLDPADSAQVGAQAAVELEASRETPTVSSVAFFISSAARVRANVQTMDANDAPAAQGRRPCLPEPTGPRPVGTTSLWLTDNSRPDPWALAVTARELMVSLWYPATSSDGGRAPYMTAAESELQLTSRGHHRRAAGRAEQGPD